MNKEFEKIIEEAKKIRLEKDDKNSIRNFLMSFIEKNPVRQEEFLRHQKEIKPVGAWSNYLTRYLTRNFDISTYRNLLRPMTLILIIALVVGGGASVAAENSIPGDVLFPVKVEVNERVMTFLAFSDEAKVKVEAKKAERRLEEAVKLSAEGRLNAEASAKIEDNFEKFADRVEARIEKLKAEGKAEAALEATSNFEAALQAHEEILGRISELKANGGVIVAPIKARIQIKLDEIKKDKEAVEAEVEIKAGANVEAAAEGKMTAAENKINEVKAFIEKAKAELGTDATVKAEARLRIAEEKFAQGKAKFEAGAHGEAFVLFQESMKAAQEAKLLVRAEQFIDLKVEGVRIRLFGSPTASPSPSPTP